MLALTVGQREDLPAASLKQVLAKSMVRRRLVDMAKPKQKAAINQAMTELSGASNHSCRPAISNRRSAILALHQAGNLDEAALLDFARQHKYEKPWRRSLR
jgi:magnesium-transporting ATPase (P-type)